MLLMQRLLEVESARLDDRDSITDQIEVVDDDEPPPFGPSPVIRSQKTALIPLEWEGRGARSPSEAVQTDTAGQGH